MIRKSVAAICLCLLIFLPLHALGQEWETGSIDMKVDDLFRRGRTVGGSVVIAHKGEVVYARDYGYQNLRRREPVTADTYFRVASVTKMVTGIGTMRLFEKGMLDPDGDISAYFGYKIRNPRHKDTPLTLRQLMSHTSSVSENGGFSNIRRTVHDMLSTDVDRPSNFESWAPGSAYQYSNFGAGLVGAVMEAAAGKSVNAVVREEVFAPLDMDAAYAASLLKEPQHIASQYENGKLNKAASLYIKEGYEDTADPEKHFRTTVGELWIRSRDLAKLAVALCGDGSVDGERLLSPQSVNLMRAEQKLLGGSVKGDSPYGLFVQRVDSILEGKMLYGHQGLSNGRCSNVYFDPDEEFVFVMTTNGASNARDKGVAVLAQNLLRFLYPLVVGQ